MEKNTLLVGDMILSQPLLFLDSWIPGFLDSLSNIFFSSIVAAKGATKSRKTENR
jgi:hypothetical protein